MARNVAAWACITLAVIVLIPACSDDNPVQVQEPPPPPASPYLDATSPDNVMANMVTAINRREIDEYGKVIDPGFGFYFVQDEFLGGDVRWPEWGRDDELKAMRHMFDLYYPYPKPRPLSAGAVNSWTWGRMRDYYWELFRGEGYPAASIEFEVISMTDWIPSEPYESELFAGETHMESVIEYEFTLVSNDVVFTSSSPRKAVVHMRHDTVGEEEVWQLVGWHDDVGRIANRYRNLTSKDHLFENLELAYNQRNYDEYQRLHHAQFLYLFAAADNTPAWQVTEDLAATANIFFVLGQQANENDVESMSWGAIKKTFYGGSTEVDKVVSVELDMDWEVGEDSWLFIGATENDQRYLKPFDYNLTVKGEAKTYATGPRRASFIAEQAEVDGVMIWQIRTWTDDILW